MPAAHCAFWRGREGSPARSERVLSPAMLTPSSPLLRRPRALPRGSTAEAAPGHASGPDRLPHCPKAHPSEQRGRALRSQAGVGPGLAGSATCCGRKAQAQGEAEGYKHVDPADAEPASRFGYLSRPLGRATPLVGHRQVICGLCKPTPHAARGRSPAGEAAWGPRAGLGRSGATRPRRGGLRVILQSVRLPGLRAGAGRAVTREQWSACDLSTPVEYLNACVSSKQRWRARSINRGRRGPGGARRRCGARSGASCFPEAPPAPAARARKRPSWLRDPRRLYTQPCSLPFSAQPGLPGTHDPTCD